MQFILTFIAFLLQLHLSLSKYYLPSILDLQLEIIHVEYFLNSQSSCV